VSILDRAKPARAEGPAHILVHGEAGAGKTYAIRTLPAAHDQILVLACEPGARSLSDTEIPVLPIRSVADLRAVLVELRESDRFAWIVVDSLSELASIVLREEIEANKDGRLAYGAMASRVRTIVAGFLALGRNTLWIARQDCDIDSQSGQITRRYPSMPGKLLALRQPIAHDFDFVLSLTAKRRGEKTARLFQTTKTADPSVDAKVRDPRGLLDPWEPADFSQLLAKVASEEEK
jgi:hypothetical protein